MDLALIQEAKNLNVPIPQIVESLTRRWLESITDVAGLIPFLAQEGIVACIDGYHGIGPQVSVLNETVTSTRRCGPIIGYTANRKSFSFSIRIRDEAITRTDEETGEGEVGAFRSFALLDSSGQIHDGWRNLTLQGDLEPEERELLKSPRFVSPDRANGFQGGLYLTTKIILSILDYRAKVLRSQMSYMLDHGIHNPTPASGGHRSTGPSTKTSVMTLTAEVDAPELIGDTSSFPEPRVCDPTAFAETRKAYYKAINSLLPRLRYFTRVVEYAWFLNDHSTEWFPLITIGRTAWSSWQGPNCLLRWRNHSVMTEVPVVAHAGGPAADPSAGE